MKPAAHQIESILAAAVEMDSEVERREFVDRACAGDAELKGRVEELLDNHFRAGSFLESPVPNLAATGNEPVRERPGTIIGPYKLLQQIGEGGMGTVFMAEQSQPVQRKVALKIIKQGMDSRQVIARFEAERQALALMDHPNIAKVLDAGTIGEGAREEGREASNAREEISKDQPASALAPHPSPLAPPSGRPYFVMELVKGIPITKYCDDQHLTPKERLELFIPVCQAVQHAHQKGIIHRDLKPSNVMIALYDGKPVPKVIDFGVAKATGQKLTEKTLFTEFGQVVGTLEYMSPEQAELNQLDIDTRSDIYALGVLLYELLTGTTPLEPKRFQARAFLESLRLIREEEPPRPSTRLSSSETLPAIAAARNMEPAKLARLVRGELDWIVMKCLEKNRDRRYETANGLARDVERYLHDEPVLACPPSAWYRFRKFARRNHVALLTAALIAVALVVGTVVSTWQAIRATLAEGLAQTRLEGETAAREDADEALQAEKLSLYFQRIALAERELASHRVGSAEELLEQCPPHLRGWEWIYLKRRRYQEPLTIQVSITDQACAAFSPDGQLVASAGDQHAVEVWDARNGQKLFQLPGHTNKITALAYSPDGRFLASTSWDGTIRVWDTATRQSVLKADRPTGRYAYIEFSPDGHRLASTSQDPAVQVWDATSGRVVFTLRANTGRFNSSAFSPDGSLLATTSQPDYWVQLWDARTGEYVRTLRGHTDLINRAAFSPDGKLLATASRDYTAKIWDTQTGQVVHPIRGHSRQVFSVAFSPDGRRLATAGGDMTVKLWDPRTGQEALTLRGHGDAVHWVAFSRDDHRLASASWDGTVKVWDATPLEGKIGQDLFTLDGHAKNVRNLTFSPDGKVLASASEDQTIKLSDAATGQELRTLGGHTHTVWDVRFSGNGRRLASASADGTVRLWDATTGLEIRTLGAGLGTVESVAFHPDNQRVAAGSIDGTVRIWNAQTGQELLTFPAHSRQVPSLVFSPDGQYLVSASSDRTRTIAVWDATTGKLIRPLLGHTSTVWGVACSRDGRRLASASWDGTARVWDLATGKQLLAFHGHLDWVYSVAFSPDGRFLASGGQDAVVRVWDATTGTEKAVLRGHSDRVLSVAFSPDGQRLASSSGYRDKGEVKVWDATFWEK